MECSYCGSADCESNRLNADRVRSHLIAKGAPSWFSYGCWAASHIVNIDRPQWICNNCGNRF